MFELLILDIDGVLTDGRKYYDKTGKCFSKQYNDKDFTAIKRFKASGIKICFLSGDNNINENMAKMRNIDFYFARQNNNLDKSIFVNKFEQIYNILPHQMAYVGDDSYDIEISKDVGYAYCPKDSPKDLQNVCVILDVDSGKGVIRYLYDMVSKYG